MGVLLVVLLAKSRIEIAMFVVLLGPYIGSRATLSTLRSLIWNTYTNMADKAQEGFSDS